MKDILEKAIQKAIDGGWKQDLVWVHGNVKNPDEVFMKQLEITDTQVYWAYDEGISAQELIFNHEFAKALWGEDYPSVDQHGKEYFVKYEITGLLPRWKSLLQNMVIADDPIKYLGENI